MPSLPPNAEAAAKTVQQHYQGEPVGHLHPDDAARLRSDAPNPPSAGEIAQAWHALANGIRAIFPPPEPDVHPQDIPAPAVVNPHVEALQRILDDDAVKRHRLRDIASLIDEAAASIAEASEALGVAREYLAALALQMGVDW